MNVAMEAEKRSEFTPSCPSQSSSSSSSSISSSHEALPPENDSLTRHCPRPGTASLRPGTVIPNRLFVGGIDLKVNESDLRHVFSQHGAVKEVKIVIDRTGMSKGYGFVTFETQDDALKILHDANGISFKDKKLSIGQAVRRQHAPGQMKCAHVTSLDCAAPRPISWGPADAAYSCHNGVTYFHWPNSGPPPHSWPPAPPMTLLGPHPPVYQQPAYHHHQYQWNVVQAPMLQNPVVYSQQSEYLAQAPPPLPVMEDTAPEFVEPAAPQVYPVYPPTADGMTPFVLQHHPRKNVMFRHARVHPKAKYRQFFPHEDHYYLPKAAEPPEASVLCAHQPLM
ncbi:protein boule-like [Gasterosteus aculeatus]